MKKSDPMPKDTGTGQKEESTALISSRRTIWYGSSLMFVGSGGCAGVLCVLCIALTVGAPREDRLLTLLWV